MKTINVKSKNGPYRIVIGSGILGKTGALISDFIAPGARIMVVSQANISKYSSQAVASLKKKGYEVHFHKLPDGEIAKSEKEVFRLLKALLSKGFERKDGIVAVGGGVVSDLSGFAASVYLRGIRYVNVATTLLAQVDSSIGGKTGINLPEGKNLMGAFYPPVLVVSDVAVLRSLPGRETASSLAEAVKYGVIRDAELFRFLEKNAKAILRKDLRTLERIVTACAKIKAAVVTRDEFETKGERMILNYGHTFGHGIENACHYKNIVHGEAVAIGMAMAAHVGVKLGLCEPELLERQRTLLKVLGLPVSMTHLRLKASAILRAMMQDKKKLKGKLRFILPVRLGKVIAHAGITDAEILQTLRLFGAK